MLEKLKHVLLDTVGLSGSDLQKCWQCSLGVQNEVVDWITSIDAAVAENESKREKERETEGKRERGRVSGKESERKGKQDTEVG